MDENRYIMGIGRSSKVVFSKYQKQAFMNQAENREWTSHISAIGTIDQHLPSFIILRGKKWKDNGYTQELKPDDRISLNENG